MSYRQLTEGQRYQISLLLSQEFSLREIAKQIGVAPSTISRELRRKSIKSGLYEPDLAYEQAIARRRQKAQRISEQTETAVLLMLSYDWSPEQISAICKRIRLPVSHEWIYTLVLTDYENGGKLYKHLRHQLKTYRKRYQKPKGRILGRRSIHDRPTIVDTRERYGDWEVDTVIGKRGTGAIVTVLERKSRFYLTKKIATKLASDTADAVIAMLAPFSALVHTITEDNGLEFAEHERIAEELNANIYFADPYASWQRGANENANGLFRQYVPKGTDLRTVTDAYIEKAQKLLNLRPKKCLGFNQPERIFKEQLQQAMSGCCS